MAAAEILVVEDEAIVALDIQERLGSLGYEAPGTAATGARAIELAEQLSPDLVLMDIRLQGDMDGIEAAEQIRRRFNIPVVYLTANADSPTLRRALESEPFGYIIKPFEERELHTTIQMALYKHHADRKLRESEQWLTATLRGIGDAVIATDEQAVIKFMNPVAETLTGWAQADAFGRPLGDVFNVIDAATRRPLKDPTQRTPQDELATHFSTDAVLVDRRGGETPIDNSAAPIRDEKGQISGVVLIFSDVSERKQNEALLRASEERFAKMFNAGPHPMTLFTASPERRCLDVNEAFVRCFGYTRSEAVGGLQDELGIWANPQDLALVTELLGRNGKLENFELAMQTRESQKRDMLLSAEVVEVNGQTCALFVTSDITERKRLEEQLRQAQKMEAIGTLAGGVAHDFNNLLTAILGYSDLALLEAGLGAPLRGCLEEIKKAGERAAALTRQLLTFSRKQVLQPRRLNLNETIADVEKMLRRIIGEDIHLVTRFADDLATVRADAAQVQQIVFNLAVNSRDAMPRGGRLTIETANVTLDHRYARFHINTPPGDYVMLAVSDTGCGMDRETMSHIFEPFFTTKEVGKGTGLGLATVYGIVEQSGGTIWVYSEVGVGTTFKIYLPQVEPQAPDANEPPSAVTWPGGCETILLVEDEDAVRQLVAETCKFSGYTVLEAAHGEEALRLARQYSHPIDLLVTDMVMPQMGGGDLARHLTRSYPGLKVLFMSGYTRDVMSESEAPEPIFLQKPFTPQLLTLKIREALGA